MIYIANNIVPILTAALAGLVFGVLWRRATDGRDGRRLRASLAVAFVAEFWLACILAGALILAPPEAGRWIMTVATPIVIWIGFVLPALVVSLRHGGASTGRIAIEGGHWLGVMVLQAVVMQTVGLARPV